FPDFTHSPCADPLHNFIGPEARPRSNRHTKAKNTRAIVIRLRLGKSNLLPMFSVYETEADALKGFASEA
ncbi:MAG TPA: hypothetical protein VGA33_05635, partial [Thermoanaerobaculia bacterium]